MSRRRRAGLRVAAGLGVLAAIALLVATQVQVARAAFSVSVTRTPVTRPLADDFLGLALEYNTVPQWTGPGAGGVNAPLVGLVRALDPVGRPLVRVGGQSADRSWWPVPGLAQPLGVTYDLTPAWTAAARTLARSLDARLMLGLNLEANRTRIPQQQARRLLTGIGSGYVSSFQLGNEPELYHTTPWYRVLHGRPIPWYSKVGQPVFSRGPTYDPLAFTSEFSRMIGGLPQLALAGPETGNPDWMLAFTRFVSPRSRVRMLTFHGYGNSGCARDPSNPDYPTIPHLLSSFASRSLLAGFSSSLALAHHDGASFRLDELGSVTCNGRAGVSDTMASALWVMDALFSLARSGVDGVNLHTFPNSVNGLFDFRRTGGRWEAVVHPLYYGALMFARAAPPGSRLLPVGTGNQEQVRAWATLGADRQVRVLLINDSLTAATSAEIHAPIGYGSKPAMLQRLRAPSAAATGDVTLGGRQFGGSTSSGVLAPAMPQTVTVTSGTFSVSLPASSAALLVLSAR
jgi:Glycosyl hydrolase family 79 C-terminal beta domain